MGETTGHATGHITGSGACRLLLYSAYRACWPSFLGGLFLDVLFLDPHSWTLVLGVLLLDPRSWILVFRYFLGVLFLVPGAVGYYAVDSCLYWLRVASCGAECYESLSGKGKSVSRARD
jgi:hypothetical protein